MGYQDGVYFQRMDETFTEMKVTLHEIRDLLKMFTVGLAEANRYLKGIYDDTPAD